MRTPYRSSAFCIAALAAAAVSTADTGPVWGGVGPTVDVEFEINRTTVFGESVFVLGDIAELGADISRDAIKLSPGDYPTWRVTIALPAGVDVSYRFITRADGPGQQNTAVRRSGPLQTMTVADAPRPAGGKVVFASTSIENPVLHWRDARLGGAYETVQMNAYGPAGDQRPSETRWYAWGMHERGGAIEFYIASPDGTAREPASGTHRTGLDGAFVQAGQVFSYVPAAAVSPARRNYSASNVPTLFSPQLNQNRGYRVFLPRGYDQHPERSYPVL